MLYSLPIDNLRVRAIEIIYFDGSRPVNLLDDIGAFPFREELSCKKSNFIIYLLEDEHELSLGMLDTSPMFL